jgi:spore maturation protein CgeB
VSCIKKDLPMAVVASACRPRNDNMCGIFAILLKLGGPPMKILYFGTQDPTSTGRFYAKALEDLGHCVQSFDPLYFHSENGLEKIFIKLRKAPLQSRVTLIGEALLALCRKEKFDWLFVLSESFLDPEILQALRKENPGILLTFHSHDNLFCKGILKSKHFFDSVKEYDVVFTNKTQNVSRYEQLGARQCYFIPSAYEPTIHRPIPDEKSLYGTMLEVSFVGTYDGSRDKYVEAAGWEHLQVWGNGWKRYPKYFSHRDAIRPRAVYASEFADVVSHSRINLGLLREEADDRHTIRTFEIPACGGFQLAPRNEEILTFFDENKEIACFGSLEEMKEKIAYFLSHEAQRNKIAEAGHRRCLSAGNSYRNRIEEIVKRVNEGTNYFSKNSASRAK